MQCLIDPWSSWWFQDIWNICLSHWIISPGWKQLKKYLKPPPSGVFLKRSAVPSRAGFFKSWPRLDPFFVTFSGLKTWPPFKHLILYSCLANKTPIDGCCVVLCFFPAHAKNKLIKNTLQESFSPISIFLLATIGSSNNTASSQMNASGEIELSVNLWITPVKQAPVLRIVPDSISL